MPCALLTLMLLGWAALRFVGEVWGDAFSRQRDKHDYPAGSQFWRPMALWVWLPLLTAVAMPLTPVFFWGAALLLAWMALMPSLWARWVTVPLGLPRLSWLFGRISTLDWREDNSGGAYALGMWAWTRGKATDGARAWLDGRANAQYPATAGVVFGWALGRAHDGQHEQARQLMRSIGLFDVRYLPRPLLALTTEWRVADALERGDREQAQALLAEDTPRTHATHLLQGLLAYDEQAVRRHLLFAPHTWQYLDAWRDQARRRPSPRPAPQADTPALALHLALLATERPDASQVLDVARAWEREGLDDPLLRQDVVEDLAKRIEIAPQQAPAVLQEACALARNRLQSELELTCERLRSRVLAGSFHDPETELLAFCLVRERYEALCQLSGKAQRRVAWQGVHRALTPLAVRLYNERQQKPLSNAMTRWLLHEATAVGDERGANLHQENLACFGSRT